MKLNVAKKPAMTAKPNDQPRTLVCQSGIHVRSSPIITPNIVTDVLMHAAVTHHQHHRHTMLLQHSLYHRGSKYSAGRTPCPNNGLPNMAATNFVVILTERGARLMEQPLPQCWLTNSMPRAFFPRVAIGCRLSLK